MISAKTQYSTTDFELELLQFCHEGGRETMCLAHAQS